MNNKQLLEVLKNFEKSEIRKLIEGMVQKDKDYFTEEKTREINDFLKDTGWEFYGKLEPKELKKNSNSFYFAAFGIQKEFLFYNETINIYYKIGKPFDLDRDIARCEYAITQELKKQNYKEKRLQEIRNYWKNEITKMSVDKIVEILTEFSFDEEYDEDTDYDYDE